MRYGEERNGESDRRVQMVSGDSSGGMTTIFGLLATCMHETVYTVEVVAETSAGIGVYSHPQTIQTPDGEFECSNNH